jgi:hypothetical protein
LHQLLMVFFNGLGSRVWVSGLVSVTKLYEREPERARAQEREREFVCVCERESCGLRGRVR